MVSTINITELQLGILIDYLSNIFLLRCIKIFVILFHFSIVITKSEFFLNMQDLVDKTKQSYYHLDVWGYQQVTAGSFFYILSWLGLPLWHRTNTLNYFIDKRERKISNSVFGLDTRLTKWIRNKFFILMAVKWYIGFLPVIPEVNGFMSFLAEIYSTVNWKCSFKTLCDSHVVMVANRIWLGIAY